MKIYFTVDDKGYLDGWGSTPSYAEGEIELDIEDDHDIFTSDSSCWKYENGKLVFDEERQQQLIEEYEREKNKPTDIERLEMALMELAMYTINGGKE
ncbi:hypothetical protein [Pueribacillus sp. YX66]|uniref:hypothetical protein n=1 Tax=Pueribacillus sp. YX66 TaxID=3229242 RepID=UPI00358D3009